MERYALIHGTTLETVRAYLPRNYAAIPAPGAPDAILILGHDSAGWTLDDYVIPRLASGLIFAKEVHPETLTVPVREMRLGDLVEAHGMVCLVDGPLTLSRSHEEASPRNPGGVWYIDARVINRTEVPNQDVPYSFTERPDGVHRWNLQGNDWAQFRVIRF